MPASIASPPPPVTASAMRAPARGVGALAVVADEQERRHARQLPEDDQQQQVVGEHDAEHRRHEHHQLRVELAGRVVGAEVVGRVQHDQRADAGDEQPEHQPQAVEPQAERQADVGHPVDVQQERAAAEHVRGEQRQAAERAERGGAGDEGRQAPPGRRAAPAEQVGEQRAGNERQQDDDGEQFTHRKKASRAAGGRPPPRRGWPGGVRSIGPRRRRAPRDGGRGPLRRRSGAAGRPLSAGGATGASPYTGVGRPSMRALSCSARNCE